MDINLDDHIKQPFKAVYLKEHEELYKQLLFLNTSVFYLEKLSAFPSRIFLPETERIMWNNTMRVYIEQIILIIGRIAIDEGNPKDISRDVISFPRFKRRMLSEFMHLPLAEHIALGLDKFDAQLSSTVIKPFKIIRDKFLAHIDYQLHMLPMTKGIPIPPPPVPVDLKQIQTVRDALVSIFDILSFDHHWSLWYWDLLENRRDNGTTDIDFVLDGIAKEHYLIKQPPPDVVEWFGIPEDLPDKDLEIINEYRERFGIEKLYR